MKAVTLFEVELEGSTLKGLTEGQVSVLTGLLHKGTSVRKVINVFNKHLKRYNNMPAQQKMVITVPKATKCIPEFNIEYKVGRLVII